MDIYKWIVSLILLLQHEVLSTDPAYYCVRDGTETITNVTTGLIYTRESGQEFYADNLQCSWKLDAGAGQRFKLTVVFIDIQWTPTYATCSGYDLLDVWEGTGDDRTSLTSICHAWNPYTVISKDRYLDLSFSSTLQNFANRRGLTIKFEAFANNTCPPDWFPSPLLPNDCIMIQERGAISWDQAQDTCTYNKANLASILSEDEYDQIMLQGANISKAWIGFNDLDDNHAWTWVDRQPVQFTRTVGGGRFDRLCVLQDFTSGDWEAQECSEKHNFICKGNKNGLSILYPSEIASAPPDEEDGGVDIFLVIIIIAVLLGLLMVSTIFMCVYYQRHGHFPCNSPKKPRPKRCSTEEDQPTTSAEPANAQLSAVELRRIDINTPVSTDGAKKSPPPYSDLQFNSISTPD